MQIHKHERNKRKKKKKKKKRMCKNDNLILLFLSLLRKQAADDPRYPMYSHCIHNKRKIMSTELLLLININCIACCKARECH